MRRRSGCDSVRKMADRSPFAPLIGSGGVGDTAPRYPGRHVLPRVLQNILQNSFAKKLCISTLRPPRGDRHPRPTKRWGGQGMRKRAQALVGAVAAACSVAAVA